MYWLKNTLALTFFVLSFHAIGIGQNLEEVISKDYPKSFFDGFKDAKPFDIGGNLSLGLRYYGATGIDNRQSPFVWNVAGNTQVSIYKLRIPFSAFITAQSSGFTTPNLGDSAKKKFVRIGASPYYKWAKLHVGHRSMNFSSFTLAKHTFLGVGTELNPGNFRFAAMYGKLPQTAPRNLAVNTINDEVFFRKGWGTKIGYGTNRSFIDLILFGANDEINTNIPFNQDSTTVFPNDNLVIGLNGKTTLFNKFNIYGEIASSALTANRNDPSIDNAAFPHPAFLFDTKSSSSFNKAINTGVTFNAARFSVGLDYKRIDPGYRSLGAYFFQDDFENITANTRWTMFKQRVTVALNGGLQRNNLELTRDAELRRTIGSAMISYTKNELTLSGNYSNYNTDLSYVLNPELDSLNAVVVTQTTGITGSWNKSSDGGNKQAIILSLNLQNVSDEVTDVTRSANSQMKTANLNYTYSTAETNWKYKARLTYNQNELTGRKINRIGFGGGVSKMLLEDKLTLNYDLNYFDSSGDNFDLSTLNNRFGLNWKVTDAHSLLVNLQLLNRNKKSGSNPNTSSEQIGNIRYGFRF